MIQNKQAGSYDQKTTNLDQMIKKQKFNRTNVPTKKT